MTIYYFLLANDDNFFSDALENRANLKFYVQWGKKILGVHCSEKRGIGCRAYEVASLKKVWIDRQMNFGQRQFFVKFLILRFLGLTSGPWLKTDLKAWCIIIFWKLLKEVFWLG